MERKLKYKYFLRKRDDDFFLSAAKIRCRKTATEKRISRKGRRMHELARTVSRGRETTIWKEKKRDRNTYITYKPAIGPWMSRPRTQRHTKLAQYVIQPKNTPRSRHFAPRMRVSKGIKDSKASFAQRA